MSSSPKIEPATDDDMDWIGKIAAKMETVYAPIVIQSIIARAHLEAQNVSTLKAALLSLRAKELELGYPPCDDETVELIDRTLLEVGS